MKKLKLAFAVVICLIIFIISCTKTATTITASKYATKDSMTLSVDSCQNLVFKNVSYNICFDTLLSESRCPYGAMCPWAGFAAVRLKCNFNNQNYFLQLATDSVIGYKNDTIIMGIKFQLSTVTPHPATTIFYPYSAYKARVIISQ